jgi:hypothetical protein
MIMETDSIAEGTGNLDRSVGMPHWENFEIWVSEMAFQLSILSACFLLEGRC